MIKFKVSGSNIPYRLTLINEAFDGLSLKFTCTSDFRQEKFKQTI